MRNIIVFCMQKKCILVIDKMRMYITAIQYNIIRAIIPWPAKFKFKYLRVIFMCNDTFLIYAIVKCVHACEIYKYLSCISRP